MVRESSGMGVSARDNEGETLHTRPAACQDPRGLALQRRPPPSSLCGDAGRHAMRVGIKVGLMALGVLATAATAPSDHRLVVVVGRPGDPRGAEQHASLAHDAAALRDRDVVVQDITPAAARRERPELGVRPSVVFEVLLVGKDGGVKLRREAPVAASEITALIDTMPMRQEEMRAGRRN